MVQHMNATDRTAVIPHGIRHAFGRVPYLSVELFAGFNRFARAMQIRVNF